MARIVVCVAVAICVAAPIGYLAGRRAISTQAKEAQAAAPQPSPTPADKNADLEKVTISDEDQKQVKDLIAEMSRTVAWSQDAGKETSAAIEAFKVIDVFYKSNPTPEQKQAYDMARKEDDLRIRVQGGLLGHQLRLENNLILLTARLYSRYGVNQDEFAFDADNAVFVKRRLFKD